MSTEKLESGEAAEPVAPARVTDDTLEGYLDAVA